MGAEETIDHGARRDLAVIAAQHLSHERQCSERWEAAREEMREMRAQSASQYRDIKSSIGSVYGRIWWIVGLLIGAQAAVIALLAARVF